MDFYTFLTLYYQRFCPFLTECDCVPMREEERETDRETERQRDRETERQRDRETERQRDRETDGVFILN